MVKKKQANQLGEQQERKLPLGVKLLRTLKWHRDRILSVAFDPSGKIMASSGRESIVGLWDVDGGKLLRTLEGHGDIIHSVAFDPSGKILAGGGYDNTVMLWDVDGG